MDKDEMLSIPLKDGTRLRIGECFTVEDWHPFFSDGKENYNAKLVWDNAEKCMYYSIYPISDRVKRIVFVGRVNEIPWRKIRRRDPIKHEN